MPNDTPIPPAPQGFTAYQIDADEVEESYQAFAALRIAAAGNPALIENKYFTALQDTAYARFLLNFEAL